MSAILLNPDYPVLDIQDRSATVTLPTTPTVYAPSLTITALGITYDSSTGIITLPESRVYSSFLVVNANVSGSKTVNAYVSVNTGSGFVISQYSGRQLNFNGATDGQLSTVSRNFFAAGTQLKFYVWGSTSGTVLATQDLTGTSPGTVTAPASRLMIGG